MGTKDSMTEGTFLNVDGTDANYLNANSRIHADDNNTGQDCVFFRQSNGFHDQHCIDDYNSWCEKNALTSYQGK